MTQFLVYAGADDNGRTDVGAGMNKHAESAPEESGEYERDLFLESAAEYQRGMFDLLTQGCPYRPCQERPRGPLTEWRPRGLSH
jgi:hypothetical protein